VSFVMRFLAPLLLLGVLLGSTPSHADPQTPKSLRKAASDEVDRLRFGITKNWSPRRLGRHIGFGVGWSLPQRWYDTDGQLLTERSLLHPGDDLERSGLYLALRF
jgi:hypothetical protein